MSGDEQVAAAAKAEIDELRDQPAIKKHELTVAQNEQAELQEEGGQQRSAKASGILNGLLAVYGSLMSSGLIGAIFDARAVVPHA